MNVKKLWIGLTALWLLAVGSLGAQVQQDQPLEETPAPAIAPTEALKPDWEILEPEDPERHRTYRDDVVRVGEDFVLKQDEEAQDVVIISGSATIKGRVRGDLVVIGGSATVEGRIEHDMVVVMGSAKLGPKAEVRDHVVVVGGGLEMAPGAKVKRHQRVIGLGPIFADVAWAGDYFKKGFMMARPIPPQLGWAWAVAAIFLAIYFMLALLFPRPVTACVDTLETRPLGAFLTGILVFLLFGPLLFILVVSVAGILIVPFLFCALAAALLFGKTAVYRYTGQQLGRQLSAPTLQLPLVGVLIGGLLFSLFYTIPVLGFLVWGALLPLGVGAAVLAAVGGLRREESSRGVIIPAVSPSYPTSPPPVVGSGVPYENVSSPLVSAEQVTYARAGFWRRLCGTILDAFLVFWIASIVGPFVLVFWLAYHIALWTWKGTTVGGIVVGIKVIRMDGRPLDFATALVRGLSSFFSAMVFFLGFFWAGWDREKQSWHDKIAGTVMVKVPRGVSLI